MEKKFIDEKYLDQVKADRALRRIKSLVEEGLSYRMICETLTQEGYLTISGKTWTVQNLKILIYRLRHKASSFYAISQKRCGFEVEELA